MIWQENPVRSSESKKSNAQMENTIYGGIVLATVGSWEEFLWCFSWLFIGDVVSCDVCGRWQPGEEHRRGGHRRKLQVGGSLDHWGSCKDK